MLVIAPIEDLKAVKKELLEVRVIRELRGVLRNGEGQGGKIFENSGLKKAYLKICNWKA